MHQALYRKYRPATFEDVWGQKHITDVLRFEAENGRISHAYLFCGTRGTGKTSLAKLFAKAVNCENPIEGSPCGECAAVLRGGGAAEGFQSGLRFASCFDGAHTHDGTLHKALRGVGLIQSAADLCFDGNVIHMYSSL